MSFEALYNNNHINSIWTESITTLRSHRERKENGTPDWLSARIPLISHTKVKERSVSPRKNTAAGDLSQAPVESSHRPKVLFAKSTDRIFICKIETHLHFRSVLIFLIWHSSMFPMRLSYVTHPYRSSFFFTNTFYRQQLSKEKHETSFGLPSASTCACSQRRIS